MKLHLLHMFTLCVCIGQIYSLVSIDFMEKMKIQAEKYVRRVFGVSEQFVSDFVGIVGCLRGDANEYLADGLMDTLVKHENSKFDVEYMKNFHSICNETNVTSIAVEMDKVKIVQSILSKQLPPERYNGLINLLYIFKNPNVTSVEITSALNYLYGIDTDATKTSFLNPLDFPYPTANDCPSISQIYSKDIDELKSMVDIKPKVVQDYTAIREKFTCNVRIRVGVSYLVLVIKQLHGNESKIDACMIRENPVNWEDGMRLTKEYMEYQLQGLESMLSTRLEDETIRGIINFKRATIPDTSINGIEKALEYLYDDIPETKCS